MTTITERVAAGAAFLDEHDPEWWKADVDRAIDLDRLELANASQCILGQRCPLEVLAEAERHDPGGMSTQYWAFALHLSGQGDAGIQRWAIEHGFAGAVFAWPWPDLTAEWKRVITERRSA